MTQIVANNGTYKPLYLYDSIVNNDKNIVKSFRSSKSEEITQMEKTILKEIANNYQYRESVFKNDTVILNKFINQSLNEVFDFTIRICDINQMCGLRLYRENVYSEEIIISSTLKQYSPKKLVLFVWVSE